MSTRSVLRATLLCLAAVSVNACGGSTARTSTKPPSGVGTSAPDTTTAGDSTAWTHSKACTFFNATEVASLFGTRPRQTFDPFGIGGTESNCLWKATAGGEQSLLQIAIFDGMQHYEKSDKSGAQNLPGFGDKAFIKEGDIGGVSLEFVRANKTYFFLFSMAKTASATRNDANAKADQLLALIRSNTSRL